MSSHPDAETPEHTARDANRALAKWRPLIVLGLLVLVALSLVLALTRIYQVDEAQNLYMARVSWLGASAELFTSNALHLFPLGWLTTWSNSSAAMFASARLAALAVFWVNTALLAKAAGVRLASPLGLIALAAAATLAPMWDYGFEIRHENLLLCGLLVMWLIGRRAHVDVSVRMAVLGALSVLLNFIAAKAVVYTVPLSGLLLLLPAVSERDSVLRRIALWIAGAVTGFMVVRLGYAMLDAWPAYLRGIRAVAAVSAASAQGPGLNIISGAETLARLVSQTPLLLATTAGAFIAGVRTLLKARFRSELWHGGLAESTLLVVSLGAFFINPAPFPYNLLLVVPFAFLASAKWVKQLAGRVPMRAWIVLAPLLVTAHCVPFAHATARHFGRTNQRQVLLMAAAEALTDPERDRVYDATGLVVSRKSIHRWWYLHSLSVGAYGSDAFPTVEKMLSDHPAAVVIKSYRTNWIRREDHAFIAAHYVPLSDDFWILGALVDARKTWRALWPGRYALRVAFAEGQAPPSVRIDGTPTSPGIVSLQRGDHVVEVQGGGQAALVWVGPTLAGPIELPPGGHNNLFVNWY